jgi:hypothetical protein
LIAVGHGAWFTTDIVGKVLATRDDVTIHAAKDLLLERGTHPLVLPRVTVVLIKFEPARKVSLRLLIASLNDLLRVAPGKEHRAED